MPIRALGRGCRVSMWSASASLRTDAPEKVTGRARYTAETVPCRDAACGDPSLTIARGRVELDLAPARAIEGVVDVIGERRARATHPARGRSAVRHDDLVRRPAARRSLRRDRSMRRVVASRPSCSLRDRAHLRLPSPPPSLTVRRRASSVTASRHERRRALAEPPARRRRTSSNAAISPAASPMRRSSLGASIARPCSCTRRSSRMARSRSGTATG